MTAEETADAEYISKMLIDRDIDAFVAGDWGMVRDDFDEDAFVGYDGADPEHWTVAFATLHEYAERWSASAAKFAGLDAASLKAQLMACQRIDAVEFSGERCVARKVFDGFVHAPSGPVSMIWTTNYFLRRRDGAWKITGFVGYLPRTGDSHARISEHGQGQHRTAGPYRPSLSVRSGRLVVTSGQGPLDLEGNVVGDTIEEQTRLTLENCERQLAAEGAALSDVFKVNAYLADLEDWSRFNGEYAARMPNDLPVRTTVGARLLGGMKVEIDMWAAP